MALHVLREETLVLPEGQPAGVAAAVEGALQAGKVLPEAGAFAAQDILVIGRRRGDVGRRAHAPLDLEGSDARLPQAAHVLPHAEVGRREEVTRFTKAVAVGRVELAAGLFAQSAVARIAAGERGEVALPRKAGAQRALHEHLRFDLAGDGGDAAERRFPCQDDAREAAALCQARAVHVAHPRLGGEVQDHFGISALQEPAQKHVLQDERVGARVPRRARTGEKVLQLAVLDQRIERDVHLGPEDVRPRGARGKFLRGKIGRAFARGKIAQAEIDGVRARIDGGFETRFVPRGGQDLTHG